ncbi:MAG TPA: DUF59 domain-containing protein [Candidatus Aenigmarchaeota archaeon]|nr:MAG: aromatic ring hydroxylase [Candidatus Aenigmarchaeota archaeon]HDD46497.1 DUF59 domain-containing protein [Candidatus Aenigmarchaeota archaeon]
MVKREDVLKVLEGVVDPEIGINIVDLGLIYGVEVKQDEIKVRMTLTTPACPLANNFVREVEERLREAFKTNVNVELVFDPPWTPERMSKKVRDMVEQ